MTVTAHDSLLPRNENPVTTTVVLIERCDYCPLLEYADYWTCSAKDDFEPIEQPETIPEDCPMLGLVLRWPEAIS